MNEPEQSSKLRIVVKLHSEIRRHGLRDKAKSQKVSNRSALASRGTKLLGTHKTTVTPDSKEKVKRDRAFNPQPYGKHDGSIHSSILLDSSGDVNSIIKELNGPVNSMVLAFQNMPSIDLQAKKIAYSDALTEVMNKVQLNGSVLIDNTETVDAVRKSESFTYVRTQIVVMVYSDTEFEGGTLSDRGDYEMILLSKVVMTNDLLDLKALGTLLEMKKDPTKIKGIEISTNSRPGIIVDRPNGNKGMRRASDLEIQNFRRSQDK